MQFCETVDFFVGVSITYQLMFLISQQSVPTKKETERETKVQYVYKHGTQTIVVDRPLTEEELSKLKFPLTSNQTQQQQHHPSTNSSQLNKQAISIARPAIASHSVSLINVPSTGSQNSVESLANTLISQIQTPVQVKRNISPTFIGEDNIALH